MSAADTVETKAVKGTSLWQDAMRRLRKNQAAIISLIVLVIIVLLCFLGPTVLGLDGETQNTANPNARPTGEHIMGTDKLGRDYFARVLQGGQMSFLIALCATAVSLFIGVFYGAIAGYYGGLTDNIMMRIVDFLYGVPYMFLVILIMLLFTDKDRNNPIPVFAALGAVQWLTMARIVRGQVLSLRNQEFIEAARAMGASDARIITRHVLPNCIGPIVVYATLTIPAVILLESFLSFLGLGLELSWGLLVAEAIEVVNPIRMDWWLLVFPSILLGLTLLSLNFVGDGLRDALDPKRKRA
ncbi:MAG: ABC transporter permease [Planctomycetota bacterium]|nr:ABC transporter permease [Planctomycetota bacterium]